GLTHYAQGAALRFRGCRRASPKLAVGPSPSSRVPGSGQGREGGTRVLSIGKLGRGQENYYLATVASGIEDYYTGSGEAPGEWTGAGAARLGLRGEVDGDELRKILGGVDPRSDEPLGGHTRKDRVPGWDLTFSAPKSVSVLYALGGEQVASEVVAAHGAAVAAGLGYLERHGTVSRRRVDGAVEVVRG